MDKLESCNLESAKRFSNSLSLESLKQLKQHVDELVNNRETIKKEAAEHDQRQRAKKEWFALAWKFIKQNKLEKKHALEEAYRLLPDELKWTRDFVTECSNKNIPCDVDECWYDGNLDRFDGTLEFFESVFVDRVLEKNYVICDVCFDNDRASSYHEVDLDRYVGKLEKFIQ